MRLIDADELVRKYAGWMNVYSPKPGGHESFHVVTTEEIGWMPTIDAIPVEWLSKKYAENEPGEDKDYDRYLWDAIAYILTEWQKEQEAR